MCAGFLSFLLVHQTKGVDLKYWNTGTYDKRAIATSRRRLKR